ncbi:MAG: hypothetical protein J1G04_03630 [Clostridiales bacterium]|nr:hypothetical protein [Clostridiales bacterium]
MDENVMQNLKKLIDYQKKDIELRKLTAILNSDEALINMNKNKKAFDDAKQTLSDSEEQSGELIDMFAELEKYVDENEALLAEFENAELGDETEEALAERLKKLESVRAKFQNAEKKAHDINDKSGRICQTRNEAIKTGKIAKQKYADAKAKHSALVSSKADEMNKLKSDLEQLAKTLDKEFFEEYNKLAEEKKFPPVVMARGDEKKGLYNCGGCGLSLPQQGNALLNDNGWCRCDNCRRIIVRAK